MVVRTSYVLSEYLVQVLAPLLLKAGVGLAQVVGPCYMCKRPGLSSWLPTQLGLPQLLWAFWEQTANKICLPFPSFSSPLHPLLPISLPFPSPLFTCILSLFLYIIFIYYMYKYIFFTELQFIYIRT